MATFEIDPETGEYRYIGKDYGPEPSRQRGYIPNSELGKVGNAVANEEAAYMEREKQYAAEIAENPDDRPFFAQNAGQFFRDLGKSIVNPAAALVTDYVDLGHGLVDVARETGDLLQGKEFDLENIFDDSDNPLTKARIDNFRSETQAGQMVSSTLRVAGALLALPKLGIKGLVAPLKLLSKTPAVGKIPGKGAKLLQAGDKALKATRAPKVTKALEATKGGKATKLAGADDWLKATYKDVVNAGVKGNSAAVAMRSIERSAKQLTKGKSTIRTVGEALAWDAFVAFNVAGEGNDILDETFSDFLADVGLPSAPIFQSDYRDEGLVKKFKLMGEGMILGGVLASVFDVARIYRFSKAFQVADPTEQKAIITALNAEGEELGAGLAKLDEVFQRTPPVTDAQRTYRQTAAATAARESQSTRIDEMLGEVEQMRAQNRRLEEQFANFQQYQRDFEDASKRRAEPYGQIVAQQPRIYGQGVDVEDVTQARGGDLGPSGQLTVPQERIYGQEVDVRDITPLRIDGTDPALLEGGARTGVPSARPSQPELPGAATPAQLAGAPDPELLPPGVRGGELAPIRPPEPTITPQTIRAAFDDYVKERFQDTGYASELLQKTQQLLPRMRVDAIEYMEKFPERFNAVGMMSASDGVIEDYFVSRGLAEGWASFDENFNINFNRKAAYDLDVGDFNIKQAQKIDEAQKIERYNKALQGYEREQLDQALQQNPDGLPNAGATRARQEGTEAALANAPEPLDSQLAKAEGGAGLDAADAPTPAQVEARRQAQMAGLSAEELANAEQREIIEAAAKYGDIGSDRQIVAEMLSIDIDKLPKYQLQKLGRKYQIVDANGELIDNATYSTQKLANKALARAEKEQLEGYVAEARALADRGRDQVVDARIGVDITDSPLVRSELNLTERQAEVLTNFDIADLDPFNLQLNMSQAEMSGLSQQVQAAMETASGPEKTVLKNVMNKLNEQITNLGPKARLAAEIEQSVAQGLELFQNGRICL